MRQQQQRGKQCRCRKYGRRKYGRGNGAGCQHSGERRRSRQRRRRCRQHAGEAGRAYDLAGRQRRQRGHDYGYYEEIHGENRHQGQRQAGQNERPAADSLAGRSCRERSGPVLPAGHRQPGAQRPRAAGQGRAGRARLLHAGSAQGAQPGRPALRPAVRNGNVRAVLQQKARAYGAGDDRRSGEAGSGTDGCQKADVRLPVRRHQLLLRLGVHGRQRRLHLQADRRRRLRCQRHRPQQGRRRQRRSADPGLVQKKAICLKASTATSSAACSDPAKSARSSTDLGRLRITRSSSATTWR
ncbi:hypothetical protein BN871_BM_00060 [Paenibacillus sp. P22]|nr:hypothetical protein BN871_BM_00060 [Paenibacillus sp. P22]